MTRLRKYYIIQPHLITTRLYAEVVLRLQPGSPGIFIASNCQERVFRQYGRARRGRVQIGCPAWIRTRTKRIKISCAANVCGAFPVFSGYWCTTAGEVRPPRAIMAAWLGRETESARRTAPTGGAGRTARERWRGAAVDGWRGGTSPLRRATGCGCRRRWRRRRGRTPRRSCAG